MKYTLLELVQTVLSSTDGEEVNSIDDTVESSQVVEIIKTVYNDLVTRGDIASTKVLFTLTASGDSAKPVLMTKPSSIANIDYVKYNCEDDEDTDPVWRDMIYLPIHEFVNYVHTFRPSESDVDTMTHTLDSFNITFNFYNDRPPQYYTVLEDNSLIFDGYDSTVDTTLQSSKSIGYGTRDVVFVRSNTWVPELEAEQFALLLNEAKSLAWVEQKQSEHPKAEQAAKRNWQHLARTRRTTPTGNKEKKETSFYSLPNFSRK